MTVKQLIAKLQKEDPNAIVIGTSSNYEKNGAWVKLSSVYGINVLEVKASYRDDFDGGSYEGIEYTPADEERTKSKKAVKLYF